MNDGRPAAGSAYSRRFVLVLVGVLLLLYGGLRVTRGRATLHPHAPAAVRTSVLGAREAVTRSALTALDVAPRAPDSAAPPALPNPAPGVAGAQAVAGPRSPIPETLRTQLSEEQLSVLREHSAQEIGQLVAGAHRDSDRVREAARPEAARRYRVLLDLWLKLHPQAEPDRAVELLRRQEQYFRDLPAEESRLFHLPLSDAERRKQLDDFKGKFFSHAEE